MIGNIYKYALIDFSYIMSRNLFACSKGKGIGEFNEGDVMKLTIQTLNKLSRDWGITVDKPILIFDSWDKTIGGYQRSFMLKDFVSYKGSRKWMTEEKLRELKNDPTSTQEIIEKAELELYTNQIKFKAKHGIINDFNRIGLPAIGVESFEFDDLAWLATGMLYGQDNGKPSIIITKDSDLQYSLSPQMSYFRLPTAGSEPKVITYQEMYDTIPQELTARGVGLYQYKAFLDSLGFGHNDMKVTKKRGVEPVETIIKILNGDYSNVEDVEAFTAQMNSFDLNQFPRILEAKNLLSTKLDTIGHIGNIQEFHDFCNKYNITGISDDYYQGFVGRFDQKLFSE